MASASSSATPITWAEMLEYLPDANRRLRRVDWTPRVVPTPGAKAAPGADMMEIIQKYGAASGNGVSLVDLAKTISRDDVLLQEDVNVVMTVLREGMQVASHLVALYRRASNLTELETLNSRGRLTASEQQTEFNQKLLVAGAIAVFVLARYVVLTLKTYKSEEVSAVEVEFSGLPELSLQNPVNALSCVLFYYGKTLEFGAKDGLAFVRLTDLFFRKVLAELAPRVEHLEHAQPFTEQGYLLEGTEFGVHGFDASDLNNGFASVEFARQDLDEVVGNRQAKHTVRRIAERLVCFDLETGRNPMFELGALSTVNMFHGIPGTGKSMLLAALATLIHDFCEALGIPFLFHPLPGNIINSFQGKSAEQMEAWFAAIRDPHRIVFAPIDDAENVFEDRTGDNVSEGSKGAINAFLRNTEGATAINRGNAVILVATNLPDKIDAAVMSRVNLRAYIGGAEKREDFLDQNELWRRKYDRIAKGLMSLTPSAYEFMSAQVRLTNAGDVMGREVNPEDDRLRKVYEATLALHKPEEEAFYAEFFVRVQEIFPFFRSRDLRNIQRAIDSRVFDFDMPEEWLTKPDTFHLQPYDTKLKLVNDIIRGHVTSLDPAKIRLQETVSYVDNLIRAVDEGRRRHIEEMAERIAVNMEAEALFRRLHGGK